MKSPEPPKSKEEDRLLELGYSQELLRRMSAFSNYAISLSMICILAGGITSFHQGLCSMGGAVLGVGWPLVCLFSLSVAATMGQVASAFPTAGGLYHWASLLGGKGWGWITAWFNLLGLIALLSAINLGTLIFVTDFVGPAFGFSLSSLGPAERALYLIGGGILITLSQAAINHRGIKLTTRLTDFSGYWILGVSLALTIAMLYQAEGWPFHRLISFTNFSGKKGGDVWPETNNPRWLFLLGLLLPAYTITGFDASAHTAEETLEASKNVPKGIVRSVAVSGLFGWVMLSAIVMGARDLSLAAAQGENAFHWILSDRYPGILGYLLSFAISIAQYLCGLATVTSTSRMAYAFARDGGLPWSSRIRRVSPRFRTPTVAIWLVSGISVLFLLYTPVYETMAAACALFLYLSYVLPTALGLFAYGRSWKRMGPWDLGKAYPPLAVISVLGCAVLILIGLHPPNEKSVYILGGTTSALMIWWFVAERYRFRGPPALRGQSPIGTKR